jgi:hypothetical protein
MKALGAYSSKFQGIYHDDTEKWEVAHAFWFTRPSGEIIVVPAGFQTDLASTGNIPGFPKDDCYNQACVVHDYLYSGEFVPRGIADRIFREALEAIPSVPRWKIPVMVFAVRCLGWLTYREHTARSITNARELGGFVDMDSRPLWTDGTHF